MSRVLPKPYNTNAQAGQGARQFSYYINYQII